MPNYDTNDTKLAMNNDQYLHIVKCNSFKNISYN